MYSCNFISHSGDYRRSRALPLCFIPFFTEHRVTSGFANGVNTNSQNGLDRSFLGWTGSFEILAKTLFQIAYVWNDIEWKHWISTILSVSCRIFVQFSPMSGHIFSVHLYHRPIYQLIYINLYMDQFYLRPMLRK